MGKKKGKGKPAVGGDQASSSSSPSITTDSSQQQSAQPPPPHQERQQQQSAQPSKKSHGQQQGQRQPLTEKPKQVYQQTRQPSQQSGPPQTGGQQPGPPQAQGQQPGPPRAWGQQPGPPQAQGQQPGPPQPQGQQPGPPQAWGQQPGPRQTWGQQPGLPQAQGQQPGPPQAWGQQPGPPQAWGQQPAPWGPQSGQPQTRGAPSQPQQPGQPQQSYYGMTFPPGHGTLPQQAPPGMTHHPGYIQQHQPSSQMQFTQHMMFPPGMAPGVPPPGFAGELPPQQQATASDDILQSKTGGRKRKGKGQQQAGVPQEGPPQQVQERGQQQAGRPQEGPPQQVQERGPQQAGRPQEGPPQQVQGRGQQQAGRPREGPAQLVQGRGQHQAGRPQEGPPQQVQGRGQQQAGGPQDGPPQQVQGRGQQQAGGPQDRPPQQVQGRGQQQAGGPPQQVQGRGQPQARQQQERLPPQVQGRAQQQPQGRGQQQPGGSVPGAGPPTKQLSQLAVASGGDVNPIKPMEFIKAKPGTKGRKIPIETNHLLLNLGKLQTAIHYDVSIDPDTPKKYLRNVMELCRQKYYPNRYPAFDGRKNMYSSKMMDFGKTMRGEVIYRESDGREKEYKIEIKFAKEVDLRALQNIELSKATPRDALQVLDIVLRSAPASSLIPVGQSFFVKPPNIIDLGEGMEMYHGFYQSAIRGWKPFLNVDVAHKAFPKTMNVVDALTEVLSTGFSQFSRDSLSRPLDRRDEDTFTKFIKQLRVIYEIPGNPASKRAYRVNGLDESASRKRFKLDSGQEITIEQYFQNQKRYRLRYPMLQTLWVGDRQRQNRILLPMELCTLEEGQVLNRKMTERQTAAMIKSSATNTNIRKQKIYTGVNQANYNAHPSIKEFGFSVSNAFEKLDARVLVPPKLEYLAGRSVMPSKGIWRGEKFFLGMTIKKWTIVAADRRPPRNDDLNRLEDELYRQAEPNGLTMETRAEKPFVTIGDTLDRIKSYFQSVKDKNYDVIFVVVPNTGQQYSFVKTAAEINVGCLTQCIKSRTVQRINVQTSVNILLKVNAKLNGTNHYLGTRPSIMNRPTMIMGADVTHPSPDSINIPSVAAVTASHDPKAFKYNICWRLQPPKQEVIDDLESITYEHLQYFYSQNRGMKPERIIFFRDGVSEGQFDEIRRAEIRAIRSACKKMQPDGYEPSLTFLVVQKRHHTRFFPLDPRDSQDRNNNVPAGTCVDYQITHPFMQDFYLVSHASIQGVAKPTKYCTLFDENNLLNDEMEELTYFLCHMFTRCNRSVSYPAPTYYAHLAAARAKVYIENERVDLDNLRRECQRFEIKDVIRKGRPMFFV